MTQMTMKKCWSCNSEVVITSIQCPFCKARLGLMGADGVAAKGAPPTSFENALHEWNKLSSSARSIIGCGGALFCMVAVLQVADGCTTFQNRRHEAADAVERQKADVVRAEAAKVEAQRLAAIEAAKTPEQRAAEQAAKAAAIAAAAKERARVAAVRDQYEKLFHALDLAIMDSELVASEMAETNTTNGYYRKRDSELRSSRDKAARNAANIMTAYRRIPDGEQGTFNRVLQDTVFNASDTCTCANKAAAAWISFFQSADREDLDRAHTYVNLARAAESRYESGKAQVLAQAGSAK